ncbi:MAG: TonB-dependent receptor [Firmicutes bacterium]|nr:TonB-dependent receptor [Bacillota bacterium]
MSLTKWSAFALSALTCAMVAQAQTSTTSGAVRGTVKSKQGGVVAAAQVTLRNRETGLVRTAQTDQNGVFSFTFMPVGDYEITVTAPGLRTVKDGKVRVSLGQTTTLGFSMDRAEASAVVEVAAVAEGIDTAQVNSQTSISSELVESIPVNGRNFTDLVLLTPGAAPNAEGYRQTVEGARGIQNNLQIDGASFNSKFNGEQRGGTRIPFAFGQDTIKELQVVTNSFDAQYGDSAGAVINAVTKTGTNDFSGTAMIQLRPNWGVAMAKPVPFSGANNSEAVRRRDFNMMQGNFTMGGPIIKDKLFFFVGVEGMRWKQDNLPGLVAGVNGNSQAYMDAFYGPTGMGSLIKTTDDGRTITNELGTTWTNDIKNYAAFARVDWMINADHRAAFRVNVQDYTADNNTWSQTRRTDQAFSHNAYHNFSSLSWVAELTSSFTPNLVNEARLQISSERRPSKPNSTTSPEISLPGFAVGRYYIEPRGTDEITNQLQDTLTWMQGDWILKGGVDLQKISYNNLFYPNKYGGWSFASYYQANNWFNGVAGTGGNYPSNPGSNSGGIYYYAGYSPLNGYAKFDENYFAGFLNAQYAGLLDKRLVLSLGFRYTSEQWSDNPNPNARLAGLDRMPDNSALDPRFGFSFDVFGDARTVVRGGYGHFSVSNPAQTASGGLMNNGLNMLSFRLDSSQTGQTAYFAPGTGMLSAAQRISNGRITSIDPATFATMAPAYSLNLTVIDPEAKMAKAKSISLGVEQEVGDGLQVGASVKYKKFTNLQYFMDINLWQINADGTGNLQGFYKDGYPTTLNSFTTNNTGPRANLPTARPGKAIVRGRQLDLTGYGAVGLSRYDGEGNYKAFILEAKRMSRTGWGFTSSLTVSRAEDNNSNERATAQATVGNTYNPADPLGCWSLSDNDRSVRGVFAWYSPKYFGGLKWSGVFTYATGNPWTAAFSNDINFDGVRNDPAFGERNTFRQPEMKTCDMRLSYDLRMTRKLGLELALDVYNVFNWANQRTSKYNFAQGPTSAMNADFAQIDGFDFKTREMAFTIRFRY